MLVNCLPTAWSLPVPSQRFWHVPLQGRLSRLYNLSRPFEGVSLFSMDLRCLQRVVGNLLAREFPLRNFLRIARDRKGGQLLQQPGWAGAGAPPMRNAV